MNDVTDLTMSVAMACEDSDILLTMGVHEELSQPLQKVSQVRLVAKMTHGCIEMH